MPALEFTRRYAMAHRLLADPASKCATPHGHNEIVRVRLDTRSPFRFGGANMEAPFERAKGRWSAWIDTQVDHCLMLAEDDPMLSYFRDHEPAKLARIMTFPGDPTTEALCAAFFIKLSAFLAADGLPFTVSAIAVEETPSNSVILSRDRFDAEGCGLAPDVWPRRADLSINDFR